MEKGVLAVKNMIISRLHVPFPGCTLPQLSSGSMYNILYLPTFPYKSLKCRQINHTWILWVIGGTPFHSRKLCASCSASSEETSRVLPCRWRWVPSNTSEPRNEDGRRWQLTGSVRWLNIWYYSWWLWFMSASKTLRDIFKHVNHMQSEASWWKIPWPVEN